MAITLDMLLNTKQAQAAIATVKQQVHDITQAADDADTARSSGRGFLKLMDVMDDRAMAVSSVVGSIGDAFRATGEDADKFAMLASDVFMLLGRGSVAAVALTVALSSASFAFQKLTKAKEVASAVYVLNEASAGTFRTVKDLSKLKLDTLTESIKNSASAMKELAVASQDAKLEGFLSGVATDSAEIVRIHVKAAQDVQKLQRDNADVIAKGLEIERKLAELEGRAQGATMRGSFATAGSLRSQAQDLRDSTEGKAGLTALEGIRQQIQEREALKALEIENAYKRQEQTIRRARLSAATALTALNADVEAARQSLETKKQLADSMDAGGVKGAQASAAANLAELEAQHTATLTKLKAQRDEAAEVAKLEGDASRVKVSSIQAQIDAEVELYGIKRQGLELDRERAIQAAKDAETNERIAKAKQWGARMAEQAERKLADVKAWEAEQDEQRQRQFTKRLDDALTASAAATEILQKQADAKGQAVKDMTNMTVDSVKSLASTTASLLDQFVQDVASGNADALANLAKSALKAIGQQLVGMAVQTAFQGVANILNPITAPLGTAQLALAGGMMAAGLGFGAAGASIPTGSTASSAGASVPRDRLGTGQGDGGPISVVMNFGMSGPHPDRTARDVAKLLSRANRRGLAT